MTLLTFCFFFILTLLKFLSCYKKQIGLSSFISFRGFVCFFSVGTVVRNLWLTPKSPGLFSKVSTPGLRHNRVEFRDTGRSARAGRSVRASGVLMCAQTETRCCRAADLKHLTHHEAAGFRARLGCCPFQEEPHSQRRPQSTDLEKGILSVPEERANGAGRG